MAVSSRLRTSVARVALLFVSTGLVLLAAELLVRWFVPVRNVGPSWTEYHPAYVQCLRKNLSCRRRAPEFDIQFTTNSLGFRGPELATASEVVLFLGDSFTMGYGVTDGGEFPAVVGERLKESLDGRAPEVLNAGIGRGNGYWVKFLRDEASRYKPSFVVLGACSNDQDDNRSERLFELTSEGSLVERPVRPMGWGQRFQAIFNKVPLVTQTYLYGVVRQVGLPRSGEARAVSPKPPELKTAAADLTLALVGESMSICKRNGWPVVLLAVDMEEEEVLGLRECASKLGVALLRMPSKKERPDLYFKVDGHWNPAGHEMAAALVARYILER